MMNNKAMVVVKHFEYKGHKFVIIRHESGKFMVIPKEYIVNGVLTKTVYGGYDTIDAVITFKKQAIDFQEYVDQGIDEMTALRMAVGVA